MPNKANVLKRVLAMLLLAGGLFASQIAGGVNAASDKKPMDALANPPLTLTITAVTHFSSPPVASDTIDYTMVAKNIGNVKLTSVSIVDHDPTLSSLSCTVPSLATNKTLSCNVTYTLTATDITNGFVTNTATATGTSSGTTVTGTAVMTISVSQTSPLILAKSATTHFNNPPVVGNTISYTLVATNVGGSDLTSVGITDPTLGLLGCTLPTLAPNASLPCAGSYILTQANIDHGSVSNTATASWSSSSASDEPSVTNLVSIPMTPHLTLAKTATTHFSSPPVVGDMINYTLVATNDGNVSLTSVSLDDPTLGTLTCIQPVDLAPAAKLTCTGSYFLVQADITTGSVSNTATATGTPPSGPVITGSVTKKVTIPPPPNAAHHIVISEFATTGPKGDSDEFIELFNPTGTAVNIGNWIIYTSSGCGTSLLALYPYIFSGTVLQPGQHYLLASYANDSSIAIADQRFGPGIDNNGGIALASSPNNIVDMVGMCSSTYFIEGHPLTPLPSAPSAGTPTPVPSIPFYAYERKPGGPNDLGCYDTSNNAADFTQILPAAPLTQAHAITMCPGVALMSPTPTGTKTQTPTRTPTRIPTAFPAVAVMNEFLPHPLYDWNGDGVVNTGDEYIEIINLGSTPLNMKGWKLDTGVNSPVTYTFPDLLLQPRAIKAIYGSQSGLVLSDGGGTVRLLRTDGRIIDAFTYPLVEIPERTWCRLPDASDHWGFNCRPTPGRPNESINAPPSIQSSGSTTSCPQVNTAPASVILAECGGYGSGIANSPLESVLWLQTRLKWGVFVE